MKLSEFRSTHRRFSILPGLFMVLLTVYYELLFQVWISSPFRLNGFLIPLGFALFVGGILGAVAQALPEKGVRWAVPVLGLLLTTLYLTEYFCYDAYHVFMTPALIISGAKGVATDYADLVITVLAGSFWRILLMLMPPVAYGILASIPKKSGKRILYPLSAVVFGAALAIGPAAATNGLSILGKNHDFEGGIRNLGIPAALVQNVLSNAASSTEEDVFITVQSPPPTEAESAQVESAEANDTDSAEPEVPVVYEPNILSLDYAAMAAANPYYAGINNYIAAQTPSLQNEYTGMFAGKNLILITAEAFTKEVIDPVRTPTLYRMATQGIEFTDYYQPAWGASTTGGEMANLFGLVPDCSAGMPKMASQEPFITIGSRQTALGYFSAAYHNNTGTFYNRNSTHKHLGYSSFVSPDQGMGVEGCWPQSDLEMIDWTLEQYIDQQPFSIYYMTVSGHSVYTLPGNAMSRKNYAFLEDTSWSEPVKCYLAAQQELEYAMESLLRQLEEAGILDDTVIVISPDHYPYGLDAGKTFGNKTNYMPELYGTDTYNDIIRDHSALIVYSGCLEGMHIKVESPTYSLDILPTLCNLFGIAYESRLLVGRDVFSDADPLVLWPNKNWITEKGTYYASTGTFVPKDGETIDQAYIDYISAVITDKINFSHAVQQKLYLAELRKHLDTEHWLSTAAPSTAASATTEPIEEAEPVQAVPLHSGIREDNTFNEHTIFLGDSQTYMFSAYLKRIGLRGDAKYAARSSSMVTAFFDPDIVLTYNTLPGCYFSPEFSGMHFSDCPVQMGPDAGAVYIMLGSNYDKYVTAQNYIDICAYVLEHCPNATVYLQTVPNSDYVPAGTVNKQIKDACLYFENMGESRVLLIDTCAAIGKKIAGDRLHVSDDGMEQWYQAILAAAKERNIGE